MLRIYPLVLCFLIGASASFALASHQPLNAKNLVKVSVLTSETKATPGKPITIGVRMKIEPKWHIYWLNPGDSGMATSPALKLPTGWTQSEWRFPLPITFPQPGGFVGYGYVDEVMLLTDVTPPADFKGEAKIDITTLYLVCEDVCIPGQDVQSITLSAGASELAHAAELVKWEAQTPKKSEEAVETKGKVGADGKWAPLEAVLPGSAGWQKVEVYPMPSDVVELKEVVATPGEAGTTLRLEAKTFGGATLVPSSISLLVVGTTSDGQRQGRWVDLPTNAVSPTTLPAVR